MLKLLPFTTANWLQKVTPIQCLIQIDVNLSKPKIIKLMTLEPSNYAEFLNPSPYPFGQAFLLLHLLFQTFQSLCLFHCGIATY